MAISTLKNLLASQYLRRGDGIAALSDCSRRKERFFGAGRSNLKSAGKNAEQRASLAESYDPYSDTCVKAFVCLMADMATDPPWTRVRPRN